MILVMTLICFCIFLTEKQISSKKFCKLHSKFLDNDRMTSAKLKCTFYSYVFIQITNKWNIFLATTSPILPSVFHNVSQLSLKKQVSGTKLDRDLLACITKSHGSTKIWERCPDFSIQYDARATESWEWGKIRMCKNQTVYNIIQKQNWLSNHNYLSFFLWRYQKCLLQWSICRSGWREQNRASS